MAAILIRPLLSAPDAQLKFFGAVLVAAAGLSFLAIEFARERATWRAVLWAFLGEQALRLLGDTFDLSLQPGSLPWMVAAGPSRSCSGSPSSRNLDAEAGR